MRSIVQTSVQAGSQILAIKLSGHTLKLHEHEMSINSFIFVVLKGTGTLMISMFIRKSSMNHEF